MWNIILPNEVCPYAGTVKKTIDEFFPCNYLKKTNDKCAKKFCPIVSESGVAADAESRCKCGGKLEYNRCLKCGELNS